MEEISANQKKVVVHEKTGDLNHMVFEAAGKIGCTMSQWGRMAMVTRLEKEGFKVPAHVKHPTTRKDGPGGARTRRRKGRGGPPGT